MRDFAGDLLTSLDLGPLMFRPAAGLPFGTLKRLEIARALAAQPRFLLMDEPAAGLTHGEVDELGDTILKIRDEFELAVLLVEHHMAMVMRVSDKVVAMDFGRKIAEGLPAEVQTRPAGDRGLPGSGRMTTVDDDAYVSELGPQAVAAEPAAAATLLQVADLRAGYGPVEVLHDVRPVGRRGRGRRHARRQRRRQDDDDAGHLGHDPPRRARSTFDRQVDPQGLARRHRAGRHRPGAAGPRDVPRAHRRGQPAHRRVHAARRRGRRRHRAAGSTRSLAWPSARRRRPAACRAASSRCWPSPGR